VQYTRGSPFSTPVTKGTFRRLGDGFKLLIWLQKPAPSNTVARSAKCRKAVASARNSAAFASPGLTFAFAPTASCTANLAALPANTKLQTEVSAACSRSKQRRQDWWMRYLANSPISDLENSLTTLIPRYSELLGKGSGQQTRYGKEPRWQRAIQVAHGWWHTTWSPRSSSSTVFG
jgi:hypothetical protein